ncbi:MAG: RluA family pseudouridine synthase [Pseudomonadales bacterium]|nr:RluA family pseudouridine synthase [Pseudomonadales bacterium]
MPLGFDIHYSDPYLLVVNKPAGLLSVPGRLPENFDSVALRLQTQLNPEIRIVHRLDCDTSGLMVLACDAQTHRELSRQFHDREVDKIYQAWIMGNPEEEQGEITLPLRYDPENKPRHCVDFHEGKAARTLWSVRKRRQDRCLVDLIPYTGRSHQLRVHMLAIGHPILGDSLYAPAEALAAAPRLCLHAMHLGFTHPHSHERVSFDLPSPF